MKGTFNKTYLPILIATLLFGSYLRLHNLGVPSFWVDELDFVEAAKSQSRVGEPLLASGYAYPRAPLLTSSLVLSYKLFGVSEFSSRLPSAIFGIMTILLVFFIGRRWFDEQVGLMAAIFVACMPFEVGWSRACRMYSLLQLTFLAGMFLFYHGFEKSDSGTSESAGTATGLRNLFESWQIDWRLLLTGCVLLAVSFTSHQNAALFLPSFVVYIVTMFLVNGWRDGWSASLHSKYGALAGLTTIGVLLVLALPPAREFLNYAVGYQPKWAEVASAQNRWRILNFMFGSSHFPLNLLFLLGALQIVRTCHKAGIFALANFVVPVLLFSFVFQYRKNDYVYHVYPILFLVAAVPLSGLARLVVGKIREMRPGKIIGKLAGRNLVQPAVLLLCLVWFPLTPGFRLGQKIPRLPDGSFNGAIYHNEWKAAAEFLRDKITDADTLISTLPLSVQYYLGRADYNLNWSNSHLARANHFVARDGHFIDFYSGADLIEGLTELQEILRARPQGWLLVDNYRFTNPVYVPKEIQTYLLEKTLRVFETQNKTITIYRWETNVLTTATN